MVKIFYLNLRERPFEAIKNRTKKIEIRANKKKKSGNAANLIKSGDIIIFQKENSNERLQCNVERITLYRSVRELLLAEGTEYTLSSTKNMEEGIKSIESINNYKEIIAKNGIFAIKLEEPKLIPLKSDFL